MPSLKLYLVSALILTSCTSKQKEPDNWPPDQVKQQITDLYNQTSVQDYQPLSYSEMDTLAITRGADGSIVSIIGTIQHTFKGREKAGELKEYTSEFQVQLYPRENDVVVEPSGY